MDAISPVKPVSPWPDGADHLVRDVERLISRASDILESLRDLRKHYNAAHDEVYRVNRDNVILVAALEEARAALFHGAPVTVGLELQINSALREV